MNSITINLLPWREERRQKRQKQLLSAIVIAWVIAGILSYAIVFYWDSKINHQNNRNNYLQSEITKLAKTIEEIEDLKQKRNAIVDRVEVIQELQADRTQIVHLFDDMVQKMPEGVYLQELNKKNDQITMRGLAQANARVSSLMKNLDSSSWFKSPTLKIVKNESTDGLELSQFNLQVLQQKTSNEGEEK